MSAALLAFAIAQASDSYLLPIGDRTPIAVGLGVTSMVTGRPSTVDEVAADAAGIRYVLVGESHDSPDHHRFQADVIAALVRRGRQVMVGFEMFTRPNQPNLAPYTLGRWSEAEFIERSNWKTEWGFPFPIYKPIFDVVRENRLPMVALNVPRDWVRAVGRGGASALTREQASWVGDLDLGNRDHRMIFDSLMGGHPPSGTQGQNIYSAQVLWDEAMAQSAIEAMAPSTNPRRVMVIVAGSGHVMYGQGIGYRITRRTGEPTLTVTCIDSSGPRQVSRSLGQWVFVSPPPPRSN
ncbi:MAG TPA: ChaN family lipoprotein [Fimbriimonadaceae bacterium]|nr:ChaN family lipoprotein [Fimbriimonadaceae bacterium]HRJ97824.1 ChaN family lipoprotein [Fimbriimonadaceae bacterium]